MASTDCFAFDSLAQIDVMIAELTTDGKMTAPRGDVITTLVALYILSEVFDDKEDEWTLLAKKAKTWLRQQGIDKPESLYKNINLKI